MIEVISVVITPKEKTKSTYLAREKVRIFSKEELVLTSKGLLALTHGSKMNRDNKSTSLKSFKRFKENQLPSQDFTILLK